MEFSKLGLIYINVNTGNVVTVGLPGTACFEITAFMMASTTSKPQAEEKLFPIVAENSSLMRRPGKWAWDWGRAKHAGKPCDILGAGWIKFS